MDNPFIQHPIIVESRVPSNIIQIASGSNTEWPPLPMANSRCVAETTTMNPSDLPDAGIVWSVEVKTRRDMNRPHVLKVERVRVGSIASGGHHALAVGVLEKRGNRG